MITILRLYKSRYKWQFNPIVNISPLEILHFNNSAQIKKICYILDAVDELVHPSNSSMKIILPSISKDEFSQYLKIVGTLKLKKLQGFPSKLIEVSCSNKADIAEIMKGIEQEHNFYGKLPDYSSTSLKYWKIISEKNL